VTGLPRSGPLETGRAPVNGIRIYYEIHGRGEGVPLVLLHGGGSTIEVTFGRVVRARQMLVEFGSQLGRALLALLLQYGAPIAALYLVLVVPPLFGCLSYSDRPGPGCYGLRSAVGLAELGQHTTTMLSYALFTARFLWPTAFLCTLLALLTK
jgi:hypothetical protein